MTFSFTVR